MVRRLVGLMNLVGQAGLMILDDNWWYGIFLDDQRRNAMITHDINLGRSDATRTDEFSVKFQRAFDLPPSSTKNQIAIFFLPNSMLINTCFKVQNLQYNFFGLKMNTPLPFGTFPKINPFLYYHPSLMQKKVNLKTDRIQYQDVHKEWGKSKCGREKIITYRLIVG